MIYEPLISDTYTESFSYLLKIWKNILNCRGTWTPRGVKLHELIDFLLATPFSRIYETIG